jgi:hypothetical protein
LLVLAALFFYTLAAQMVRDGQYVLAFVLSSPMVFMGREGYRRLIL